MGTTPPHLVAGCSADGDVMFDAHKSCTTHRIESTDQGKHSRPGWLQIQCPFCSGHSGWHGGFNIAGGYYNCWRCGPHWMPRVVSRLLNIPINVAFETVRQFSTLETFKSQKEPAAFHRPHTITLPLGTTYVTDIHKQYLRNIRHFDNYQKIIRNWALRSTGNVGLYKHRILAPIYFEHQLVSYQCRAVHLDQSPPYMACAEKDEVLHHKHLVYGFDAAVPKGQCVVVEGITDVWRLGAGAVATFGKKYTKQQILMIANNFEKVYVMLDADVDTDELEWDLSDCACDFETIDLSHGDPGALADYQAAGLMNELGF